ncbi:MAG TPA: copper chaperone PCu(A)C [Beijerinckiaceae bacterium]|nr:copper chaperone PCu(A)C [Beijerinckiaceae bacterium]
MQKFILKAGIGLAFSLVTGLALAQSTTSSVLVNQPWARATPPGAKVAGGFMVLENRSGAADRLIAATADVSGVVEIHEMAMENGVMKMRALDQGLPLNAGARVELKPGSYHIMFIDLKKPLVAGETVRGELVFEKAGRMPVEYKVMPIGNSQPGGHNHH